MNELTEKIESHNRDLEDSAAMMKLIPKKNKQKIKALQDEINKRRGVVIHSSKSGSSQDANKLFTTSKQLIESIATRQQENWDLEERVAFSRNSLSMMATEIVKAMLGQRSDPKLNEMREQAHKYIVRIAEIERMKKKSAKPKKKKVVKQHKQ